MKLSRHHLLVGQSLIHTDPTRSPGPVPRYLLLSVAFLTVWCGPIGECIWRAARVWAVGGWSVFDHREAVPTPPGGGTITHSLIRPAHLAPCHAIRYSRCLPDSLVRPIRECIWRSARKGAVGWPVFEHRVAVPTPPGGGTITHSLIRLAHLAPCHDIRYSRCLPDSLVRPIT